jgi:exodeoxyribonuclease VII small subunit
LKKESKTFEDRLDRLKAIVSSLEEGDLPLEEGVALFKEGRTLSRKCAEQLEKARNEVKIVTDGGVEDFDVDTEEDTEDDS